MTNVSIKINEKIERYAKSTTYSMEYKIRVTTLISLKINKLIIFLFFLLVKLRINLEILYLLK